MRQRESKDWGLYMRMGGAGTRRDNESMGKLGRDCVPGSKQDPRLGTSQLMNPTPV